MLRILLWLDMGLMLVALGGLVFRATGLSRPQGRHVTRPLVRRIGAAETAITRLLLIVGCAACSMADLRLAGRLGLIVYWVWLIDDVYFSDDDDRRRKWEAFKVKLKKCKPVMQRLVQRWKPSIPRVPVPA